MAARHAETYRAAMFVLTFFETLGWELIVTVVALPLGLLIVGGAQTVLVVFSIHRETRRADATDVALEETEAWSTSATQRVEVEEIM